MLANRRWHALVTARGSVTRDAENDLLKPVVESEYIASDDKNEMSPICEIGLISSWF